MNEDNFKERLAAKFLPVPDDTSVFERNVWNRAIEVAAKKADYFSYEVAEVIRKLKK